MRVKASGACVELPVDLRGSRPAPQHKIVAALAGPTGQLDKDGSTVAQMGQASPSEYEGCRR